MIAYLFSTLFLIGPEYKSTHDYMFSKDSILLPENAGVKTGFAWGVLAYDSDMGLRYGAVVNLFDYGKGHNYPDYAKYARIRLYNSTKGTSNYSLLYDSEKIFPGSHLTFEASFIEDIALDFYGFNGIKSVYSSEFIDPEHTSYINKFFYSYHRKLLRLRLDLQTYLGSKDFRLYSGITFNQYGLSDIDYSRFDIPDGSGGNNFSNTTLYQKYTDWGVFPEEEKNGGKLLTISAGLIYDTRHSKINCKGGTWFESYFVVSPPSISSSFFIKQITTFRHYMHWTKLNAVFNYRISSQQKIAGKIPFYALSTYYSSLENQDGMGGAFTLRGIHRNRIISDGHISGNFEIRKNLLTFQFLNINWETDLSIFTDQIMVTSDYSFRKDNIPAEYQLKLLTDKKQDITSAYGIGIYLIYNSNNVISVKYRIAPNAQLGERGLYIGSGFLF